MVLTSWGIPFLFTLTLVSLIKLSAIDPARTMCGYLYLLFEIILCVILIFFLASMFLVVYNLNSRDHTLVKQLSESVQFKTNHTRKRKKITNKKINLISRMVDVLDTYKEIFYNLL